MRNLVVFASGSGSNFQSIIDAIKNGELNAQITGLVSDRDNIQAIERAQQNRIPVYISNPASFNSQDMYAINLIKKLTEWKTDLIVLAGYLKKIPSSLIEAYPKRILNIHPSLLPKYGGKGFYGIRVHQAVLDAKEKESGCTVHLVTEEFDEGPVLDQIKVPVKPKDSPKDLANRVLKQEHKLYPEVIQNYLSTLN
ncbi:MAG: phosphoribosylglycinamide formyltransferase [Balneolaceae bacterium]|nr:phosphoribosylglycinamide formyltransferase [Balneolaceae bacterium]